MLRSSSGQGVGFAKDGAITFPKPWLQDKRFEGKAPQWMNGQKEGGKTNNVRNWMDGFKGK